MALMIHPLLVKQEDPPILCLTSDNPIFIPSAVQNAYSRREKAHRTGLGCPKAAVEEVVARQ